MGKGARSRANNAIKKTERKVQAEIELKKSKKNKLIVKITALTLAVVIAFSSFVYVTQYASGKYLRNELAAVSYSYEIDAAVMTYFMKTTYVELQSYYSGYFEMFTGVDTSITLQKQYYDDETTWFDYVLSLTQSTVSEIVALAEMAVYTGLELTDDDYLVIEASIAEIDSYFFEDGVKEDDIRTAFELSALAQKYVDSYVADVNEAITDSDIEDYYATDENTYQTASYYYYTLSYDTDGAEDEYTQEEAYNYAYSLYTADSLDSYVSTLTGILATEYPDLSDEDLETQLSSCYTSGATYTADDEISIWLFDDDAVVGETYVIDDEDNQMYTVYVVDQEAARNESDTVEFKHILLTVDTYVTDEATLEKMDAILAEYNENPTEENFETLAKLYSEDSGSASYGGGYSGVVEGSMVDSIDEWLFDESREYSDIEIVESDYGYHLMYYVGEGDEYWAETVLSDMEEEAYDYMVSELVEIYTTYFYSEALYKMPL